MTKVVSITSQGQISIPKQMLRELGITTATKATIRSVGQQLIVEPQQDFWSLGGSLKNNIKLTDEELRQARQKFSNQMAKTWT